MSELKEHINNLEAATKYLQSLTENSAKEKHLSEFTELRFLARSESWPVAVDPIFIIKDDDEGKFSRAENILSYIKKDMPGQKFLDYGCGEGHVARKAVDFGADKVIGYDIKKHPAWNAMDSEKLSFTDDLSESDFDTVLLNDVLDHAKSPVEVLQKIKAVKKKKAKLHVRCHPWTSRHGTHLYRQLNKAYLQLIFKEEELAVMGLIGQKVRRPIDPMLAYKEWFQEAELEIINEHTISQPIEPFFKRPEILHRIKTNWKENEEIMQIQFVDFTLV